MISVGLHNLLSVLCVLQILSLFSSNYRNHTRVRRITVGQINCCLPYSTDHAVTTNC